MNHSISPETILSLPCNVASTVKFEGLSLIRVTDSSRLQKIAGVSIVLRSTVPEPLWVFQNATI